LLVVAGVIALWYAFDWVTNSQPTSPTAPPADLAATALENTDQQGLPKRVAAVRDLSRHGYTAAPELRRVAQQATEPQVRAGAIQGLGEVRDWQSVDILIGELEHPDPLVRGRAGAALRKIMKVDFNFRAHDPADRRAAAIAHIRRLVNAARANGGAFYAGQSTSDR